MAAEPTPEMGEAGRDFDSFDPFCDHLLVIDRRPGEGAGGVVGTYRLLRRSRAADRGRFYSVDEYDIAPLVAHSGEILELGRSCIGPEHRSRAAMQLLWRGIADYGMYHDITLMFGCASLPGIDPAAHAVPLSSLYYTHLAPVPFPRCRSALGLVNGPAASAAPEASAARRPAARIGAGIALPGDLPGDPLRHLHADDDAAAGPRDLDRLVPVAAIADLLSPHLLPHHAHPCDDPRSPFPHSSDHVRRQSQLLSRHHGSACADPALFRRQCRDRRLALLRHAGEAAALRLRRSPAPEHAFAA